MKIFGKLVFFGFLLSVVFFSGNAVEASAVTDSSEELNLEINVLETGVQTKTFVNEDGEEMTYEITPRSNPHGYYLPYGTTKAYKVSQTNINMNIHFYVDVYVPNDTSKSKILKAYNADYWVVGGSLSGTKLSVSSTGKSATFSADASWWGGLGGSSVWLKATLDNNIIGHSARM